MAELSMAEHDHKLKILCVKRGTRVGMGKPTVLYGDKSSTLSLLKQASN